MTYAEKSVEVVARALWDSFERANVIRGVLAPDDMEAWEDATNMHDEVREHAIAAIRAIESLYEEVEVAS